jgi:carboxypeptidase C (cathepsin A)
VEAGYYDLATPMFAVQYTFTHMGLNPDMHKRISWATYPAGHMLYIDRESHDKMHKDVGDFMSSALPGDTQ